MRGYLKVPKDRPFFVLSAERPNFTVWQNAERSLSLAGDIARHVHPSNILAAGGVWQGQRETSYVTFVPFGAPIQAIRRALLGLAASYEQDAILYVSRSRVAYLLSSDGTKKRLGRWTPFAPGDTWVGDRTEVPEMRAAYHIVPDHAPQHASAANLTHDRQVTR